MFDINDLKIRSSELTSRFAQTINNHVQIESLKSGASKFIADVKVKLDESVGSIKKKNKYNLFDSLYGIFADFTAKTVHVVILGSKGSGKTTLWNQLQNKILEPENQTTSDKYINSFIVKFGELRRRISATHDIGGDDLLVSSYYADLINEDGVYIYYLVDLMNLPEKKEEIGSRLRKIAAIIKEKELKNCGCKIVATNLKSYNDSQLKIKHGEPIEYVKKTLEFNKINLKGIDIDKNIIAVELTEDNDIEKIKKEITKI